MDWNLRRDERFTYPHVARLQGMSDAEPSIDVLGEYGGCETVRRVVGFLDHL